MWLFGDIAACEKYFISQIANHETRIKKYIPQRCVNQYSMQIYPDIHIVILVQFSMRYTINECHISFSQ